MPADSLRSLLGHSVDYAGLFPPADLSLVPALTHHAEYIRSSETWMLGAFVLPIAQFQTASTQLTRFNPDQPFGVAALGPKTNSASDFRAALSSAIQTISEFTARLGPTVRMDQIEMPLPPDADANLLRDARSIIGATELRAFWETAADEATRTIDSLAENNSAETSRPFGFKLRTGGVTTDAFPSSEQVARALVAAASKCVPIKFTAGLHHPLRQFRAEVETKMHGFLNVLGAAVLAAEHAWDARQTAAMLEDETPSSFSFDDAAFSWREFRITTGGIDERRKLVASFGSCSFDDPRDDLRLLRLL